MSGTPGTEAIRRERLRQVHAEGYTIDQDRQTYPSPHDLIAAAVAYASAAFDQFVDRERSNAAAQTNWWPWTPEMFKPTTTERDLVKAGALLAAALDHMGITDPPDDRPMADDVRFGGS